MSRDDASGGGKSTWRTTHRFSLAGKLAHLRQPVCALHEDGTYHNPIFLVTAMFLPKRSKLQPDRLPSRAIFSDRGHDHPIPAPEMHIHRQESCLRALNRCLIIVFVVLALSSAA